MNKIIYELLIFSVSNVFFIKPKNLYYFFFSFEINHRKVLEHWVTMNNIITLVNKPWSRNGTLETYLVSLVIPERKKL